MLEKKFKKIISLFFNQKSYSETQGRRSSLETEIEYNKCFCLSKNVHSLEIRDQKILQTLKRPVLENSTIILLFSGASFNLVARFAGRYLTPIGR